MTVNRWLLYVLSKQNLTVLINVANAARQTQEQAEIPNMTIFDQPACAEFDNILSYVTV